MVVTCNSCHSLHFGGVIELPSISLLKDYGTELSIHMKLLLKPRDMSVHYTAAVDKQVLLWAMFQTLCPGTKELS